MWVKNLETNLAREYPKLNPHFVEKHGPDIRLQPNLEQRAIDGSHPRTGVKPRRTRGKARPEHSSQYKDWKTQMNIINEATTRAPRGLEPYNTLDAKGNRAVEGTYHHTVGWGFSPNRRNLSEPHFNPSLEKWLVRFDPRTKKPFASYPTK